MIVGYVRLSLTYTKFDMLTVASERVFRYLMHDKLFAKLASFVFFRMPY